MNGNENTTAELPPISNREVQQRQALGGQLAAEAAQASGGDPAQLRAIVTSVAPAEPASIKGRLLHGMSLQVQLCLSLTEAVLGASPMKSIGDMITRIQADPTLQPSPAELSALAHLGFIMLEPFTAFQLLDDANSAETPAEKTDCGREFTTEAVRLCGDWSSDDTATLIKHVFTLGKHVPAAATTTQ